MSNRHDFNGNSKEDIRINSGYICNNPACRKLLWNPKTPNRFTGRIAHMIAASPNGPRSSPNHHNDKNIISNPANGLVLCVSCETMVDLDSEVYTVELLRKWKTDTEAMFSIYQSENFPMFLTQESRTIYRDNPGVIKKFEKRIETLEIFIKNLQKQLASEIAKTHRLQQLVTVTDNKNQNLNNILKEERHSFSKLTAEYNQFNEEILLNQQNSLATQVSRLFSIFSDEKELDLPDLQSNQDPSMFLFNNY
ncbi:MAG: hypothetical protein WD512_08205 [Candidatus Paceibacterota bacterium]